MVDDLIEKQFAVVRIEMECGFNGNALGIPPTFRRIRCSFHLNSGIKPQIGNEYLRTDTGCS